MSRPSSAEAPQEPTPENARAAFAPALHLEALRALAPLAASPPQALLLEGGTEAERTALALWWAALLNCAIRLSAPENLAFPCLECPSCLQIGAGRHFDLFAVDGRISNKDDEERPGPVRALTMDRARQLRRQVGEQPHGPGHRVIILAGLEEQSRNAAANALLKILEEPAPRSVFVLVTPQREQLLPTLVSRSWALTLPWPIGAPLSPSEEEWEAALARFLADGSGWFDITGRRGLELSAVRELVLVCRKSLTAALQGRAHTESARFFAERLDPAGLHAASELLGRMQDALHYTVNPSQAADALAVELFALLHR